jgi:hypothetical protein
MTLRRLLTDPPALLGLCVLVGLILTAIRAHTKTEPARPATLLGQFESTIDQQFHECVPLGWFPDSRPWRAYFPGYNGEVTDKGALFQALWVGVVPERTLDDPHATAVKSVLDELTGLGLLERHELPGAFRYTVTHEGQQYFYERNRLGNNAEGWPYLCYSRLHVKELTWASRPSKGADARGVLTARIRFTWEPKGEAPWATPFVKAHAVELNPTSNPAEATVRRYPNGKWRLTELDFAFPLVEHPSAWKSSR